MISLVDTGAQRLRRADREPQLELTSLELLGQREPRVGEHADGPAVVGHHIGDEPLDPHPPRADSELLEQPGPDTAPLLVVRHREGHLGRLAPVETGEAGKRDDLPFQRPDERADVVPVLEEPADQISVDAADAVEPQVAATVGEAREELDEGATISRAGGTQTKGSAVPKHDVDDFVRRCVDHEPAIPATCRRRPPFLATCTAGTPSTGHGAVCRSLCVTLPTRRP